MSTSTGSIGAGGEAYGFGGYDDATESVKVSGPTDSDMAAGEFNGSFLPPEMPVEEGFALREWRRLNSIKLAEKEKREKEALREILEEAERFKEEFYRKRQLTVENRKTSNKEKEKQFVASQESFHAEASKNYWKAIAEFIPREIPNIEQRGNKKREEKKPSISVIQGPKPGKPTDMSRMRQVVIKLKHNPPTHMMKPESPAKSIKESTKDDGDGQMDIPQAGNGTTSEGAVLRSPSKTSA